MSDNELIMLAKEQNEDAEKILLKRYEKIINIIIKNYNSILETLNIDKKELKYECINFFYEALNRYSEYMDISFNTYATMIIKRNIKKIIVNENRKKNKLINGSISLDNDELTTTRLVELIEDKNNIDPLDIIEKKEIENSLIDIIDSELSKQEKDICLLMMNNIKVKEIANLLNLTPKQVSTTKNRIKIKLKSKLETLDINCKL